MAAAETTTTPASAPAEGVSWLAGLANAFPTVPERAAITLAVAVAIVVTLRTTDYLHRREAESRRVPVPVLHLVISGVSALLVLFGGVVVLGVWGLVAELSFIYEQYNLTADTAVDAVLTVVLMASAYAMTDFIGRLTDRVTTDRFQISQHEREIVFRSSQVLVYLVVGLFVLGGVWRVDIGDLLVGAGFLGIIIGLAARQTLGALLAGFVLMFSRPFEIGDWIELQEYDGIVTDITMFNTRIQTFDGEYVNVPNDTLTAQSIVNRSRKGRLRIEVEVGVDYDDDPERAATVAETAVAEVDEVLSVPSPQVLAKRFADSSVILGVRFWIDNPSARRMWRTQSAVVTGVKRAFEAEGIAIPFPQRTISDRQEGLTVVGEGADAADAESESQSDSGTHATADGGGEGR